MQKSIHIIYHSGSESGDKAVMNVYEWPEGGGIKILNMFLGEEAEKLYSALTNAKGEQSE